MPPRKNKRELHSASTFRPPLLPINQLSNELSPAIPLQVQPNLVQNLLSQSKINPLLEHAEKAYIENIEFDEEFLSIEKTWVTIKSFT